MVQEEMKKGPWTEQEDFKLASFVGLFGDRRWDFIAKVSGLNRTGKSCRLRWVNYLHPGLKRGKMTPQEEKLVMELHSKWGNRWSRIARKLPGRTDNEIKNFWRTQMRKQKAHEKKHAPESTPISPSPSPTTTRSSSCISSLSSSSNNKKNHVVDSNGEESFYDTGGPNNSNNMMTGSSSTNNGTIDEQGCCYSMDDIWKDIDIIAMSEEGCNFISCPPIIPSPPSWEYSSEPLWIMDELEESKVLFPTTSDHFFSSCYEPGIEFQISG